MVTVEQLQQQGWHLKADALAELQEEEECTEQELLARIQDIDLKKVGAPCLPEDVNRMAAGMVKGPLVLQLQGVRDITRSNTSLAVGGPRMLLLQLTDGKLVCKATEHKRVDVLSDLMLPGTKVQLSNVPVKMGVLLLEAKAVKVLGGRVENMAADSEFQKKFAGVERAKAGQQDDSAPPPFRHFIPGRDNLKGLPRGGKANAASTTPSAQGTAAGDSAASVTPSVTQATLMAAMHALPGAAGAAGGGQGGSDAKRAVDVAPAQVQLGAQSAQAGAKLLQVMATDEGRGGRRGGRGREGGGRRGRRRGRDDYDAGADDGTMTMEEYEAKQKAKLAAMLGKPAVEALPQGAGSGVQHQQEQDDEALARALQAQLDMEEQMAQAQATVQQNTAGSAGGRQGRGRGRGAPAGGGRGGRHDTQRPQSASQQLGHQHQHASQHQQPPPHQRFPAGAAQRPSSAAHSEARAVPVGYQPDPNRAPPVPPLHTGSSQGHTAGRDESAGYGMSRGRGRGRGGRDVGLSDGRGAGRGRGGFDATAHQPAARAGAVNTTGAGHHHDPQGQGRQGTRDGGRAAVGNSTGHSARAGRSDVAQPAQPPASSRLGPTSHQAAHTGSVQSSQSSGRPGSAPTRGDANGQPPKPDNKSQPSRANQQGQPAKPAAAMDMTNAVTAPQTAGGDGMQSGQARPASAARSQPVHAPGAARVAMRGLAAALGGMPTRGTTRSSTPPAPAPAPSQ